MNRIGVVIASAALLISTCLPAMAGGRGDRRGGYWGNGPRYENNRYRNDSRYNRYDRRDNYERDRRYRDDDGIGPGKGAMIGGAGGTALGAIFGGGLKGAAIGGAAGAGIGAIAGKVNEDNRRDERRERYRR
jgi:hypothetical protein